MRKIMKKAIVLLLCAVMALSCFAACAKPDETQQTDDETTAAETGGVETKDPNYEADLPEEKFPGDFNILCEGSFWATDAVLYQEEGSEADNVLDAVWRRCAVMKDVFGVDITVTPSADTTSALKNSVKSGDKSYDAICARMPLIASSAANGDLMDLYDADGLDLSKYYWDQSANEQLSIGHKLFYTVGDIIVTDDQCTWTMMFNKKIAEALDLEDLYTVVKENRWTFDYFYSLIKDTGFPKPNDQGEWDYMASYAFSTHRDMAYGFFYAAGMSFITKDSEDIPFIDPSNNEKIQNILTYSLKIMRDTQLTIDAHKWVHVDPWATRLTEAAFREDRALFYAEVLNTVTSLRTMDTDFGLLPVPKYDAAQKEYVTFVNPAASLIGIPIYHKNDNNARRSGVILEALAYYGHEIITPEFYEKAIRGKSTRDIESLDMLDIILRNRTYDLGLINDWGAMSSAYSDLVFNNKNDYASSFKRTSKSAEKSLNKFLQKIGVNR